MRAQLLPTNAAVSLLLLILGAVAIGFAPIFVRLSETGPAATAFWRLLFALPVFWVWRQVEQRRQTAGPMAASDRLWLVGGGLFFATELAAWHWSIGLTSVANATLLANFAAIFVALFTWAVLRNRLSARFVFALATAVGGTALLVGASFQLSARAFAGDLLGLLTALLYAGYQLTVKRLRARLSTATVMLATGAVSAVALGVITVVAGDKFFPATGRGWLVLVALALISHVCGQSFIAYASAHLPVTFSSLGLLVQPVAASLAAWLLLHETISGWQVCGGLLVLVGIAIARRENASRVDIADAQDPTSAA